MEWEDELERALETAVRETPGKVGVLFSGGLDSSLLAHLLKRSGKEVHLYSSGISGSHDFTWTPEAAEILGLPLEFLTKNDQEITEGISAVKQLTGEESPLLILIELPLYFISRESKDLVLVTGQGADELFLGYKKYERDDTSKDDLQRVMDHVVPVERKIASASGLELVYPYLHSSIIELAHRIPYEQHVRDGARKYVLRSTASRMELSEKIAWKGKKASQYSSGFRDAVARISKSRGKTVHELISEL